MSEIQPAGFKEVLSKLLNNQKQLYENMNNLVLSQGTNAEAFVKVNSELDQIKSTLSDHELKLIKRIYLSNSHLRELSKQVKDRVASICKAYGYDYKKASKILFKAIYSDINGQYNVPGYRELPEAYFEEIIESVKCWNLTSIVEQRIKAA